MAIDKAYDDLQEARGHIKALENRLEQAERDRDRYAAEIERLKKHWGENQTRDGVAP